MRVAVLLFLSISVTCSAQLKVAKIFSDNMVVQRDQPIHIWGKGSPGSEVGATLFGVKKTSLIKTDSSWLITFKRQKANAKPQTIIITNGNEKVEIRNVLIGDLWLCIGQSNMQWPMEKEVHYKSELPHAHQPLLRFYNPTYAGENIFGQPYSDSVISRLTTDNFYHGSWQPSDSSTVKTMSAVSYYFGKSIITNEHVPVGLIDLAIGGAPIETFISMEAFANNPVFASKVKPDWLNNDALPVWIRERGKQNVGDNPTVPGDQLGPNHPFKPGFAFASGIQPLFSFPIKGIIWYQGESNAQEIERVLEYPSLTKLMVADYRKGWGQPLPFYWVQLSSIDTLKYKGHLWPQFRDEQLKMLAIIDHGGMAVCSDIGAKDDVHPTNKKDVGERLARWALNKAYHKNIVPSGPLPLKAKYKNGQVIIYFSNTSDGLLTSDGKSLQGFSFDGKADAVATIQKSTVKIVVKDKPAYVYYGWKPFSKGNLINDEGLPASTFKIEIK